MSCLGRCQLSAVVVACSEVPYVLNQDVKGLPLLCFNSLAEGFP